MSQLKSPYRVTVEVSLHQECTNRFYVVGGRIINEQNTTQIQTNINKRPDFTGLFEGLSFRCLDLRVYSWGSLGG